MKLDREGIPCSGWSKHRIDKPGEAGQNNSHKGGVDAVRVSVRVLVGSLREVPG